jgi:hypothetical protein
MTGRQLLVAITNVSDKICSEYPNDVLGFKTFA